MGVFADMLVDAAAGLEFDAAFTYQRGSDTPQTLAVVPARSIVESDDASGTTAQHSREREFYFSVAAFTATGWSSPSVGDLIAFTVGGVTEVWEVLNDDAAPAVRHDQSRELWIVRAKKTG